MGRQVIVIGGGASGLTAAISAARQGAVVTILEHMDRVGKKILSTGNGKCNLTNLIQNPSCYRGDQPDFALEVIRHFPVEATLAFFKGLGILPREKNGYVYPNSEQAAAVLDVLRMEAEHLRIRIICNCEVTKILSPDLRIQTSQGEFRADRIILSAGSQAAPSTGSDGSGYGLARQLGHHIIKPLPALVQLRCGENYDKQLAGIRTEAAVTLLADRKEIACDVGELQLTDYGISGIPVFQISRYAAKALDRGEKAAAKIDFLPKFTWEEARVCLEKRVSQIGYKTAELFFTGLFNKKLANVIMKRAGIRPSFVMKEAGEKQLQAILKQVKEMEFQVTAVNPFAQAQTCCGGVDTREIHPDTMESKKIRGVYLAGELLDVDGICGGYNLQFAWSSGWLSGVSAAGHAQNGENHDKN